MLQQADRIEYEQRASELDGTWDESSHEFPQENSRIERLIRFVSKMAGISLFVAALAGIIYLIFG